MRDGFRLRLVGLLSSLSWVAIIIGVYFAAIYLGAMVAASMGISGVVGRLILHSMLLVCMITAVTWLPTILGRPRLSLDTIGLSKPLQWKDIAWGMGGFIGYMAFMTFLTPLVEKIAWFDTQQPQNLGFQSMSGGSLFLGFVVLTIVTPIAEEILFRGVLQGKLRSHRIPFVITALIVGGLFGLAHGQWNVGIDVFFMSLVASFLREKTGRLWPSILLHIIKNTLAFYIAFVVMRGGLS